MILDAPLPAPMRVLVPAHRLSTAWLVGPWLRAGYGLRWSPVHDAALAVAARSVRLTAWPVLKAAARFAPTGPAQSLAGCRAGSQTRKSAPPPGPSSTQARPPCSAANCATSDRPMPVPGASVPFARVKSSKTASRLSGGTPGPLSATASSTPSPAGAAQTRIRA